ncbi:hypothetical protein FOA22_17640 [Heyndrickxia oleronia]|uniref:hypothetical protein n=1 Tax=Heyndrickxia oleronia TaxID=38875 RepID=UPI00333634BE
MKGQQIVKCPQCEGNHVQKNDFTGIFFLLAVLTGWIPFLGWFILLPLFLILGVIYAVKKEKRFVCQECKRGFRVTKETYNEYKNFFKQKAV